MPVTKGGSKGDLFAINVVNELEDSEMWLSTSVVCAEELDQKTAFTPPPALAWTLSRRDELCRWSYWSLSMPDHSW